MRRTRLFAIVALTIAVASGVTVSCSSGDAARESGDASVGGDASLGNEKSCRAAGGVCITLSSGLRCARVGDRTSYPCAPNQGDDIACCLPPGVVVNASASSDAGASSSSGAPSPITPHWGCIDRPPEQVETGLSCFNEKYSWMTGCQGTCVASYNGDWDGDASDFPTNTVSYPCQAGCRCNVRHDCSGRGGVCGGNYPYCDCPSEPKPATCTPVNCGSIQCPKNGVCVDGGTCVFGYTMGSLTF